MTTVDKSLFIKHVLDSPAKIKAFVKPSRFGKTTAVQLLYDFLSLDSDGASVEHKAICSADGGRYLAFKNQHPVIHISFVDLDLQNIDAMVEAFKWTVSNAYRDHHERLWPLLSSEERLQYRRLRLCKQDNAADALRCMIQMVSKHCQRKPFILIDEYDTPCHVAWFHSQAFYQQWLKFINSVFTAALHDTDSYEQAIITGVFKFGGVLAGLPDVHWYTIDSLPFSQFFGFTEEEARAIVGSDRWCSGVKDWYGGYRMGDTDMYYPLALSNYQREFDVFSTRRDIICPQRVPKFANFWYGMFDDSWRRELRFPRPEIRAAVKALVNHFNSNNDNTPAITTAPFDDYPGDCTPDDITLEYFLYVMWANAYLSWQPVDSGLYGLKIPNLQTLCFFVDRLREWRSCTKDSFKF